MRPHPGDARGGLLCRLAAIALALAAPEVGVAAPTSYRLDPDHSFVHFEVVHFATATIRGRLGPVEGSIEYEAGQRRGEVNVRVATAGVSTGVPALDARLRSSELFDSAGFPEAFFVATRFEFEGERLVAVRGEFTLRGIGVPLTLRAARFGCRAVEGGERCGGDFEGELLRSSFGATLGLPFVADRVRLRVQVEALRG